MDTIPVASHPPLSLTCDVPSTGIPPMSVIRPSSGVGIRPSMSDTANATTGSYASVHSSASLHTMPFDALPMQFANQLRTSPNMSDLRFSGMPPLAAPRSHQPPSVQPVYSSGIYPSNQIAGPVNVVSQGSSVLVRPAPMSIPYFVASRPPLQLAAPATASSGYFRPPDAFPSDASKQSFITPDPTTRP